MGVEPRVVFDLRATQSKHHAERGIARYTNELAQALAAGQPGVVTDWLLDHRYPVPHSVNWALRSGRARRADDISPAFTACGGVYLISSPFEDAPSFDAVLPTWAQGTRWRSVAILYDLIPLLYESRYLDSPAASMAYRSRLPALTGSDRLLAISETSRQDAIRLLAMSPNRVEVIYAGVGDEYRPPEDRSQIREALVRSNRVPGLERDFILFTGGMDYRKNLEGMLAGYAKLAPAARKQHQLVVVCKLDEASRAEVTELADTYGIGERVLFTGFVTDDVLVTLTQAAAVAAFPSRYEGFGLPVLEARSCGTPVICGNNSSLIEVMPDERARFDVEDPTDLAKTLQRALDDDDFREAQANEPIDPRFTWRAAAARTAAVFDELLTDIKRISGTELGRVRIAVVADNCPGHLIKPIDAVGGVTVFADADALRPHELMFGRFDLVVHLLGSCSTRGAVDLVRSRRGPVVAIDGSLAPAYGVGVDPPDLDVGRLVGAWYPNRYRDLGDGVVDVGRTAARQAGIVMWLSVVDHADAIITWSPHVADTIALDTGVSATVVEGPEDPVGEDWMGQVDLSQLALTVEWWSSVLHLATGTDQNGSTQPFGDQTL